MHYLAQDIVVITPLYNEAHHLHSLLNSLQKTGLKKIIFGISPKSTDDTKLIIEQSGFPFTVPEKDGYDFAVEAALQKVSQLYPETKLVLFTEAHQRYSLDVIEKFLKQMDQGADLVMGIEKKDENQGEWFEKIGTKLIIFPLQIFFRRKIRDISPFRMVKRELIEKFQLQPKRFRWPTEMIVKSLAMNLNIIELPVNTSKFPQEEAQNLSDTIQKNTDSLSALQFITYQPPITK
jgi:glycosyltransferase involved in cell wall biosynthesis